MSAFPQPGRLWVRDRTSGPGNPTALAHQRWLFHFPTLEKFEVLSKTLLETAQQLQEQVERVSAGLVFLVFCVVCVQIEGGVRECDNHTYWNTNMLSELSSLTQHTSWRIVSMGVCESVRSGPEAAASGRIREEIFWSLWCWLSSQLLCIKWLKFEKCCALIRVSSTFKVWTIVTNPSFSWAQWMLISDHGVDQLSPHHHVQSSRWCLLFGQAVFYVCGKVLHMQRLHHLFMSCIAILCGGDSW